VLYNFCSSGARDICPDGQFPLAGVIFDQAGNLYGDTVMGGAMHDGGGGVIYKLSPNSQGWTETVLLRFLQTSDFFAPTGNLVFDTQNNLYGTASRTNGGVFQLSAKHGERTVKLNGDAPETGVIVDSKSAALFGTTRYGGTNLDGSIFKIQSNGKEVVLYSFCAQSGCTDGENPLAGLLEDKAGHLYGTASAGGSNNGGVVFEITPELIQEFARPVRLTSSRIVFR
jgi:uncharacterized repeat protein (TIGR03803 family)